MKASSPLQPVLTAAALLFCVLAAAPALAGLGRPQPRHLPIFAQGWTRVPLPHVPLGIAAHDGTFWVTGEHEMIARSSDGGHNWQVVHNAWHGQLLFAAAFAGQQVWAMGSEGINLHSVDDGRHWSHLPRVPASSVMRVVAADANRLLAHGPTSFLTSIDGGLTWKTYALFVPQARHPRLMSITAMAWRNSLEAGLLLSPNAVSGNPARPEVFTFTRDGGATWKQVHFPISMRLRALAAGPGGYQVFGRGVELHSPDGARWRRAQARFSPSVCQRQGCMLACHCGWVDLQGAQPVFWRTAQPLPLVGQWAAVGNVLCVVGDGLQCTIARRETPPALDDLPQKESNFTAARLLSHPAPHYPHNDRKHGITGDVILRAAIRPDGHLGPIALLAAPSPSLADAAQRAARRWRYAPATVDGRPLTPDVALIQMSFP